MPFLIDLDILDAIDQVLCLLLRTMPNFLHLESRVFMLLYALLAGNVGHDGLVSCPLPDFLHLGHQVLPEVGLGLRRVHANH